MGVTKAKAVQKVPSCQNSEGDRKAHERRGICHKATFMTMLPIRHPTHADKDYKYRLRKRSKFFKADGRSCTTSLERNAKGTLLGGGEGEREEENSRQHPQSG